MSEEHSKKRKPTESKLYESDKKHKKERKKKLEEGEIEEELHVDDMFKGDEKLDGFIEQQQITENTPIVDLNSYKIILSPEQVANFHWKNLKLESLAMRAMYSLHNKLTGQPVQITTPPMHIRKSSIYGVGEIWGESDITDYSKFTKHVDLDSKFDAEIMAEDPSLKDEADDFIDRMNKMLPEIIPRIFDEDEVEKRVRDNIIGKDTILKTYPEDQAKSIATQRYIDGTSYWHREEDPSLEISADDPIGSVLRMKMKTFAYQKRKDPIHFSLSEPGIDAPRDPASKYIPHEHWEMLKDAAEKGFSLNTVSYTDHRGVNIASFAPQVANPLTRVLYNNDIVTDTFTVTLMILKGGKRVITLRPKPAFCLVKRGKHDTIAPKVQTKIAQTFSADDFPH